MLIFSILKNPYLFAVFFFLSYWTFLFRFPSIWPKYLKLVWLSFFKRSFHYFFSVPSKAPANLTGHNTSSVSLFIKWGTIPPEYIHGILIGYKIFYVRTSGSNIPYETLTLSPETLTTELTGLLKNTEYCVRVAGFTRRGDGNLTDCLNIATDPDCKWSYIDLYEFS